MPRLLQLIVPTLLLAGFLSAGTSTDADRTAKILASARDLMRQARYCALITIGDEAQPQARTVDPMPAGGDELDVWILTNRDSRKAEQLRRNPRATLYYFLPASPGYVTLIGEAELVTSAAAKAEAWKPAWGENVRKTIAQDEFVLVHVRPRRLEMVSYAHGLTNDPKTMRPVILELP